MQVYGFLEKAQLENVTSDLSNTLTGLIWFNSTDSRARFYDGGAIRSVVDENSTQTLTGKTLTGNLIANFSPDGVETITAPIVSGALLVDQHVLNYMDFLHQSTPAAPSAGGIRVYAKNDNQLYKQDSEGNEIAIGTGGGGLDVFHIEDFEVNNAADFSSGNNATFLGGGVLAGTLTDETASPISAGRNLKYTQAAGSLNDYFSSPVIDIDPKQRGNDAGVTLYFKYSGNAGDIKFVFYDVTNGAILSSTLDTFTKATNATRFALTVFIPESCTQIRWGAQVVVANNGAVLEVDDVEFTTNPFVGSNLIKSYSLKAEGNAGQSMTANATDVPFIQIDEPGGENSWDGDQFTVPFTGAFTINGNVAVTAVTNPSIDLWVNGSVERRLGNGDFSSVYTRFSITERFNKGDVISIRLTDSRNLSNDNVRHWLTIEGYTESQNVITPAKSNVNNFSARIANNGSASIVSQGGRNSRNESAIASVNRTGAGIVEITFTPGFFTEPPAVGVDVDAGASSGASNFSAVFSALSTSGVTVVCERTDTAVNVDEDFAIKLSRQGDDANNDPFVAAVPIQEIVNYEVSANGIDGIAASTAFKTRNIVLLDGDNFASLSSNQISLPKGKYNFVVPAGARGDCDNVSVGLYNVTDALIEKESVVNVQPGASHQSFGTFFHTITIETPKTFEIRTKVANGGGQFEYVTNGQIIKIK